MRARLTEARPDPLGLQPKQGTGACSESVSPGLPQPLAGSSRLLGTRRLLPYSSWGALVGFCPHFGLYVLQAAPENLAQKTKRKVLLKAFKYFL